MYKLIIFSIVGFFFTNFIVPFINKIGRDNSFFDYPNSRKQHNKPIVRIGGLAIIFGWLVTLLIICVFSVITKKFEFLYDFKVLGYIFSAIIFFLIGFFDDIKGSSPYLRLFFQFLIASFCFGIGLSIDFSDYNFILSYVDSPLILHLLSYFFTTFYIVGLTNALNWWDGLDGLAAGVISISSLFLLIINLNLYGLTISSSNLLISILIGISLGFLVHNYKPAKIIMGDGGSYFLGFSLACLTLINDSSNINNVFDDDLSIFFSKLLPLLISLPLFLDMIKVIFIRLISSKLLVKPDRLHLHHNLLFLGLTEKKAVNQIYAFVAFINSIPLIISIDKFVSIYIFSSAFVFFIFTFMNFKNN